VRGTDQARESPGEYILIKDDVLTGTWRSKIDAINSGYERFGNTLFSHDTATASHWLRDYR
jgi:hypothetical protein